MVAQELYREPTPRDDERPRRGPRPAHPRPPRAEAERASKPQQRGFWPVWRRFGDTCEDSPGHGRCLAREVGVCEEVTTGGVATRAFFPDFAAKVVQLAPVDVNDCMNSILSIWARAAGTYARRRGEPPAERVSANVNVSRAPAPCFCS